MYTKPKIDLQSNRLFRNIISFFRNMLFFYSLASQCDRKKKEEKKR